MFDTLFFLPTFLLISLIFTIRYYTTDRPISSSSHRLTSPLDLDSSGGNAKVWHFEITRYNISLWTKAFNTLPKAVLNKCNITLARRLKSAYDIGVGFGLLGLVVSVGVGCYAVVNVWGDVWREMEIHTVLAQSQTQGQGLISDTAAAQTTLAAAAAMVAGAGADVVKRALGDSEQADATDIVAAGSTSRSVSPASSTFSGGGLQPLIPGVTMPWSHLPTLILVLGLNQLIHEYGHALAAALDDIQPARFSLNLHAGIPSMMVSFPSTVDNLDPNAKMRLAASGPFHNLMTWFFLWLLATAGAGSVFWSNSSAEGRVVNEVHWNSPLYTHLYPGDLLVHLDDVPLIPSTTSPDPWSQYLLSSRTGDQGKGWCMVKSTFLGLPHTPCNAPNSQQGELTFLSTYGPSKGEKRCLTPHPILDIPSMSCPCPDSRWVCVRPVEEERVLRIGVRRGGKDEIILWNGPRNEVLEMVKVRNQGARGWAAGVRWGELFLRYLSTIALSLFFFNLLPLPYTDGSQLLSSLLEWRSTSRPSTASSTSVPMQATLNRAPSGFATGSSKTLEGAGREGGISSKPSSAAGAGVGNDEIKLYREYELDSDDEAGPGMDEEASMSFTSGRGRRRSGSNRWKKRVSTGVQWLTVGLTVAWVGGWAMLALLRSS